MLIVVEFCKHSEPIQYVFIGLFVLVSWMEHGLIFF